MKLQKSLINFIFSALLIIIFTIGVFISSTYAQEDAGDVAAKYGITFPIAELGNCENISSCRNFCEDPVNKDSCIAFAKTKGFYKEDSVQTQKEEILAIARSELGCDSYDSCMAFCQDSSNFDRCDNFAKKHNLGGGHVANPEEQKFLAKAKEVLGCDSPSSCMNFCNDPSNRDKCSEFAKQVGIRGGYMEVGPGGCTSEETCRALCSNPQNYEICSSHGKASGESFSGPGGCNSEESCKAYCTEHPRECGFEGKGDSYSHPLYNPQEMCSKTPNCVWNNDRCECAGSQIQSVPKDYQTPQYVEPTHYQQGGFDPSSECSRTPGCYWTGSTCQCSTTGTQIQTQGGYSGEQNYTPPSDSGSGTYTQPSDSGSYAPPQSVQGAEVSRGVLGLLLDLLTNLLNRK